jgi:hypothetical protein
VVVFTTYFFLRRRGGNGGGRRNFVVLPLHLSPLTSLLSISLSLSHLFFLYFLSILSFSSLLCLSSHSLSPFSSPPAKAGHVAKRRVWVEYSPSMLEPVRPRAASSDRALCLPTFSHFVIVNKPCLSLSLSLSLSHLSLSAVRHVLFLMALGLIFTRKIYFTRKKNWRFLSSL